MPNTVSVFDFGEIPEHGLYMAMEYVPGRDLGALLAADGPFSERSAIGIAVQVLNSLAEAHDAGIIHRDIKPANLMLLRTREAKDFVKVLDFGIARLVDKGEAHTASAFQGTPEYAAPEQIRGEAVDARADLYALSATMFELVVGRPPFVADSPVEVCVAQLTTEPPRPRALAPQAEISPAFEEVLLRALAKRPEDRFQSADQMRAELEMLGDRYSQKIGAVQVKALRDAVAVDESIAQRTDWDAFDRAFRRRIRVRRGVMIGVALASLLGVVFAVVAVVRQTRAQHASVQRAAYTDEREPNDRAEQANVVALGRVVRGTIGRRLSDSESDVDAFQFTVPAPGPARVTVRASAIPNVNLAIELLGRRQEPAPGRRVVYKTLARVDDQPLNSLLSEQMDDLLLPAGVYVVQLRDRRRPSEKDVIRPRENSTDRYELIITTEPEDPLAEIEPNDTRDELGAPRSMALPVFGHAGPAAPREIVGGVATARWSDDEYLFAIGERATRACALLLGTRETALGLQVSSPGGSARPTRVVQHEREIETACVSHPRLLSVRVELDAGGQLDDRYLLVAIDDSEAGLAGVERAATRLKEENRPADAKRLLARAIAELPKAPWAAPTHTDTP